MNGRHAAVQDGGKTGAKTDVDIKKTADRAGSADSAAFLSFTDMGTH
mgnify:CR=1 FL=1